MIRLGVLEQSPVRSGSTPGEADAETFRLARATSPRPPSASATAATG
ncbi:MAG TPA: hypothetical protein QGG32_01675 [Rhodospirillales bacterium]|nr:hypothetical protein [Rhodospirillales bacterium]